MKRSRRRVWCATVALRPVFVLLGALVLVAASYAAAADPAAPPGELQKTIDHAAKLYEKGDYEGARREYEQVTKVDPGAIAAWRGLGWSLWRLGKREEALKLWQNVLKTSPEEPGIISALAAAHEERKEWAKALDLYDQALRLKPDDRGARLARARIFETQGKRAEAEKEAKSLLKQSPNDFEAQFMLARIYRDTGRRAEANRLYESLAKEKVDPKHQRYIADVMVETGNLEKAISLYEKSLRDRPGDRGSTLGLARAYALSHRYDRANAVLARWLKAHPEDSKLHKELADYASAAGNWSEAERQWRLLASREPKEVRWKVELSRALERQGKHDEAMQITKEILASDPQNTGALQLLADEALVGGDRQEAIQRVERLLQVRPDAGRLVQLGQLRLDEARLAAPYSRESKDAAAKAMNAFQQASILDPSRAEAQIGMAEVHRLEGRPRDAAAIAKKVQSQYPHQERARRLLYEVALELGDEETATAALTSLRRDFPKSIRLQQQYARLVQSRGDDDRSIELLEGILKERLRPNMPVLLYDNISTEGSTGVSIDAFRDQMAALKRAGYQTVTIRDVASYLDGKDGLPSKPVLITIDAARGESLRNAESVLAENGFRATAFVLAGAVTDNSAGAPQWSMLQELQRTGRWEVQCQGWMAHRPIPIDDKGNTGRFLTNRKWIEREGRLETEKEFAERIAADHQQCRTAIEERLPGTRVLAYAYPSGDLGQKTLANEPNAFEMNQQIAARYFRMAFTDDSGEYLVPDASPYVLSRFDVPRNYRGEALLRRLQRSEPLVATLLMLGDTYSWSGRYDDAIEVYERLAKEDIDRSELLARRGRILALQGDFAGARELLTPALAQNPDDATVARRLEEIDFQRRPAADFVGSYYEDNSDRTSFGFSPAGNVHLSDSTILGARYEFRELRHDSFDLARLEDGDGTNGTVPTAGTSDLRATANEGEILFRYQKDWRNQIRISGGAAEITNDSKPRVFDDPETIPIGSAGASFGLGQDVDGSIGANRNYVGTAGAALTELEYTEGIGQLRARLFERVSAFGQYAYKDYDGDNDRNTAVGRILRQMWTAPAIELGYQFTYDDTRERDPFFYSPEQFTAHEGVFTIQGAPFMSIVPGNSPLRGLVGTVAASFGVGEEKDGESQAQGSVSGGFQWKVARRFSLFARVGRSQAADFESVNGSGGLSFRF